MKKRRKLRGFIWEAYKEASGGSVVHSVQIAQVRPNLQRQLWRAMDAFIGRHKLAMVAHHLLGGERDLLNRQRSWYIAFTVSAFSLSGFGNGKDVA